MYSLIRRPGVSARGMRTLMTGAGPRWWALRPVSDAVRTVSVCLSPIPNSTRVKFTEITQALGYMLLLYTEPKTAQTDVQKTFIVV